MAKSKKLLDNLLAADTSVTFEKRSRVQNTIKYAFMAWEIGIQDTHLVKQLTSVIIEGFMRKHAFIIIDTVPCGVEQLAGEFT